jgi:hypothetical protein
MLPREAAKVELRWVGEGIVYFHIYMESSVADTKL